MYSQIESSRRYRQSVYGCMKRHAYSISPKGRYQQHRSSSRKRGIEFKLTFDEWWQLWKPHWNSRGPQRDKYVMARFGDRGPYELGNVRIDTSNGNHLEQPRHPITGWYTK